MSVDDVELEVGSLPAEGEWIEMLFVVSAAVWREMSLPAEGEWIEI